MITFQQQETTEIRNRFRAVWATFFKKRQQLTSRTYMLRHGLRFFDAVVSPTMKYASGTWTLPKEHERLIQPTQRKMRRLIIQTKRRYKNIAKQKMGPKEKDDTQEFSSIEDDNGDGQSSHTQRSRQQHVNRKRYRRRNGHNRDRRRKLV